MTGTVLFSRDWPVIPDAELPERLRDVRDELSRLLVPSDVTIRFFNQSHVAMCCEVAVDLPARGPVGGVDIREREPVALLFHRRDYPNKAPEARSDRPDFPVGSLPHLNPTAIGQPPCLCLHRGRLDDWFAEHSLDDYVERVRTWFRDAARGRLMREGDFFEHTRLVCPDGYVVFRASELDDLARRRWDADDGAAGAGYATIRASADPAKNLGWSGSFAVQIDWLTNGPPSDDVLSLVTRWNGLSEKMPELHKMGIGIVCWTPRAANSTYFGTVPATFGELVTLASQLGLNLRGLVAQYRAAGAHKLVAIPVCIGVLRPRRLIGRASDLEWLSFVVGASDDAADESGAPKDEAKVLALSHREPLAPSFARSLSAEAPSQSEARAETPSQTRARAILGCGALGSKLALHFARSGEVPSLLVDEAALTPHHLVRHALTARHIGSNKASALAEEIKEMFEHGGEPCKVEALGGAANDLLHDPEKMSSFSELIDATASQAVLNAIVDVGTIPSTMAVRRCEIGDLGRLGILSVEGPGRNPRLDDLQVHLLDHARRDQAVSAWLARHRAETEHLHGPALEEIGLGIGCSSTTMRLRDDVVALHAANFASAMRSPWAQGGVFLVHATLDGIFASNSQRVDVGQVTVIDAEGVVGWSARVGTRAVRAMEAQLRQGRRAERGGLLVGLVHRKRRIIYVTDAIAPSSDSHGTSRFFVRGVRDYPELLLEIEKRTGGVLGYVGEWHTHPSGPSTPSTRDMDSVRELAASLRPAGLPAHILILSPGGFTCHVKF